MFNFVTNYLAKRNGKKEYEEALVRCLSDGKLEDTEKQELEELAGIAGAILGLSTLSFYGRPQDKLSNIAIGFAIGVIGGAVYTTYKAASAPRDWENG
jgi:hypothetical protein